jgi:hypothetical protein
MSPVREHFRMKNRYLLCLAGSAPIPLDLDDDREVAPDVFLGYWKRVLRVLELASPVSGLTFYVVWDRGTVADLPTYGEDVVALVLQDEYGIVPQWSDRVRLVFKTYGFLPSLRAGGRGRQRTATVVKALHDGALWLRYSCWRSSPHCITVPLGYARQHDLPLKAFEERRYAVSFLGSADRSVHPRFSLRRILGTPKVIARDRMLRALDRLALWNAFVGTTAHYLASISDDGLAYSRVMQDTQICLAPRGSSVETYRFFEGLRYGCIVICDRLPPHSFYAGSPAIEIDDWGDLDGVLQTLLDDPLWMLVLHRRSLAWWRERCSEQAVGALMARCLHPTSSRSSIGQCVAVGGALPVVDAQNAQQRQLTRDQQAVRDVPGLIQHRTTDAGAKPA